MDRARGAEPDPDRDELKFVEAEAVPGEGTHLV